MKRSLVVAALAVLLVVQPAAAAEYPSAEAACGQAGSGESLVAIFPGSDELRKSQVERKQMEVYPGTTFKVALCKDGELKHTHGTGWTLKSTPGFEVTNSTDTTATVRVTGEREQFAVAVENKDLRAIAVDVRLPRTVDAALVDGQLRFPNRSAAENYRTAERRYLAALANLTNASDRLNESAAALEAGREPPVNVTGDLLPALDERERTVERRAAAVESTLYATAWRTGDGSKALAALSAAQQREQAAKADVKRAKQNYLESLKTAERNARTTVFVNLGGAALLGLVAGAVPGWWLTERRIEGIRFDQEINSSVSTGPRVLARVVGLAVVALGLTVAAFVALGGLDKLGGLL